MPLSHFVPAYPSPSPGPQVHSLHLYLYLNKPCPQEKPFYQSLTYLGEEKYPTPAPSSHPVPPTGTRGRLRSTVKFTVQGHRPPRS